MFGLVFSKWIPELACLVWFFVGFCWFGLLLLKVLRFLLALLDEFVRLGLRFG